MVNQKQYDIEAGPSREELFDALRLRHEGRKVTFTLKKETPGMEWTERLEFMIDSLAIEDGSGNNWIIKISGPCPRDKAESYYNTTNRKGWLKPA